ncbi:bZIP transcription factor 16 isoform X2 [Cinnamomum micranthum f. kanehirae]|uniref:BZIP transcription factor 16 isoform X2 n=1 Tax=Cinnamomum micranthum f. kanehirae TaxID=337451 RepID=A0A3S3PWZ2_9MAGN|nr:bZIP transcription factor 16 isoform X2 [Cinnamomum micranthum f. kanehirae]
MGNGEVDTPTKTPKSSLVQEQPPPSSPATLLTDWASYQAYYNPAGTPPIPPPGFFYFFHGIQSSSSSLHVGPPVSGRRERPKWMANVFQFGRLLGHRASVVGLGSHLYGRYAMPSNGTPGVSVAAAGGTDKSAEGERSPLKNSKGSLGSLNMLTGKDSEVGKTSGASGNGAMSQSGESGNEGSSEGSDANSRDGSQQKPCCEQGSRADEADNGSSIWSAPCGVTGAAPTQTMANLTMTMMGVPPSSVPGPTTNLNIGMDFWGGHPPTSIATMKVMATSAPVTVPITPAHLNGSQDVFPPELWLQDERELKRQRRKQSNRESARRSRLRKQAECEELAKHVETLKEEHSSLKDELQHMREEHEKLAAENVSLTEKLEKHGGKESR